MLLCPGTMFVSEQASCLYLHELVLQPRLALTQVACLRSPVAGNDNADQSRDAACWAPDDSAVLLRYQISGEYIENAAMYEESDPQDVRPSKPGCMLADHELCSAAVACTTAAAAAACPYSAVDAIHIPESCRYSIYLRSHLDCSAARRQCT